jgi:methyl-accepting chemotaxis protein
LIRGEKRMRWFNNLKVGKKLGLGFCAVLLIMVGLDGFSLVHLAKVYGSTEDLAKNRMPNVRLLGDIRFDTSDVRRKELSLLLAEKKDIHSWKEKIKIIDSRLAEQLKKYEALIGSDEERKLYDEYRTNLANYDSVRARVIELAEKGKHREAVNLSETGGLAAADGAAAKIQEDVQLHVKGGEAAAQTAAAVYATAKYGIVGILVVGILLGTILSITITTSVSTPVHRTMTVLESLAERDLTKTLEIDSTDELGIMAGALNRTIEALRGTLMTISHSAEQLASASEEISAGAGQTAESARVQADQTTQAAGAMREISLSVQQISDNSRKASDASRGAAEAARNGGKTVEETLSTMRGIAASTTKVASTITELGKNSEQIGKIISVIDDIADQTNLLALNAAIEAARAGEQGRGFAVVADEVRKLAERTTMATKEIAAMIESIQKETQNAVQAMGRESKEVQIGVEKTSASGTALREIIKMSENVGEMIATIATAATEQLATTEQINSNVSQISSSTQESSTASEQTAKACADLSSLAFDLQNLVNQFKLESGSGPANPVPGDGKGQAQRNSQIKAAAASAGT